MTFNQIELDAIWEGFLEAIDFTDGDRRDNRSEARAFGYDR